MPTSKQLKTAVSQLPGVLLRRLRKGPQEPGWSVVYEVLVATVRAQWNEDADLAQRRTAMDVAGRDELERGRATFVDTVVAGRPAIWTMPKAGHDDVVVLYLHGGAYVVGSPGSHRPITAALAEATCARVLAVDYRLAPEHPCPAAIDDAVAAFDALIAQGTPAARIAIAGDSAGGGLALATLLALGHRGGPLPAAGILISPWVDLSNADPSENNPSDIVVRDGKNLDALSYAGSLPLDDPRVSPINADLSGLPPMLILAGGSETLLSDSERLARRAIEVGAEHTLHVEPGEIHVYPFFNAFNPRAVGAFRTISAWLRERLGRASRPQHG